MYVKPGLVSAQCPFQVSLFLGRGTYCQRKFTFQKIFFDFNFISSANKNIKNI